MDSTNESSLDFCRICATISKQTDSLFEFYHNGIVLVEMLEYCLKRPIYRAHGLPQNICVNCKANLITTYDFHSLCESSEQFLLDKFNSTDADDESIQPTDTNHKILKSDIHAGHFKNEVTEDLSSLKHSDEHSGYKVESMIASELVCVEENFDENSIILDENLKEFMPNKRLRSRDVIKSRSQKKKCHNLYKEKVFECFDCKENFERLRNLRLHMQNHSNEQKPFECTTCNMRFVHLNSWFRHRSRHTKDIHDCEYCDESFNTLTSLKHHIQEKHKDRLNAYKCDQCSEEFALRFLLIWHKEWHKKAKQLVCTTCDAVFFSERKLKAHIRDNHASKYHLFE